MKSAHRHELQTNALAQRLEVVVDRLRPYVSTIAGVIIAVAVAVLIWSYMSKSSASRQVDAWNAFNQVIGSSMPNLEELQRSAEEYSGTPMQELASITWADGQVFNAAQSYLYNRRAATEALNRARSAYQGILQTSKDERLHDRAHLGLARVHEMRNELDKAREEYLKVRGGYAEYAKAQAERLSKPEAKETYAWLDKAVPPRTQPPAGPGTPGRRPEFDANDLSLPEAARDSAAPGAPATATTIEEMLKELGPLPAGGLNPPADQTPPGDTPSPQAPVENPATEGNIPTTEDALPADGAAAPSSDTSAPESAAPEPGASAPADASTTEEKSAE